MTSDFRKHRDEELTQMYWKLVHDGKSKSEAVDAVYLHQRDKYGLSFLWVMRICRGYVGQHLKKLP